MVLSWESLIFGQIPVRGSDRRIEFLGGHDSKGRWRLFRWREWGRELFSTGRGSERSQGQYSWGRLRRGCSRRSGEELRQVREIQFVDQWAGLKKKDLPREGFVRSRVLSMPRSPFPDRGEERALPSR